MTILVYFNFQNSNGLNYQVTLTKSIQNNCDEILVMGKVSLRFMARRCGSFQRKVGWEIFGGCNAVQWTNPLGPIFNFGGPIRAQLGSFDFGPYFGPRCYPLWGGYWYVLFTFSLGVHSLLRVT